MERIEPRREATTSLAVAVRSAAVARPGMSERETRAAVNAGYFVGRYLRKLTPEEQVSFKLGLMASGAEAA